MADDNTQSPTKDVVERAREILRLKKEAADIDEQRKGEIQDMEKVLDDIVKHEKSNAELSQISADLEDKLLQAQIDGNTELIKEIGLMKKVIKAKMKANEAAENINDAWKKLGSQIGLGGLISLIDEFGEASRREGGEMLMAIMAIGLVVGGIVSLFQALAAQVDDIGNKFGAIGVNEFGQELRSAKVTAQSLGYSFEEASGAISELSDNFGVGFGNAADMSGAVLDTARALGISTTHAATLTGMLMTIGGHSADSAQNFMKQTAALAKSAGVAPGAVMADMAGASEDIAGFMLDGGENIAQAAVKARSMGLSLSDVTKSARGLLNLSESITAELEASVMIGRQLNLTRAREKALAGDLIGFQNEILDQVGSEADFLAMNVLQREALAAAVGMEVSQLTKLVSESGKTTAELAKMRELSIDEIVSKDALSMITQFGNMIKSIGTWMLQLIAFVGTFGGTVNSTGGMIAGFLTTAVVLLAIGFGLFAIKAKLAALAIKIFGSSATGSGKAIGAFGKSAMAAIPILLTIALVGASIAAIFFGMGYVIEAIGKSGSGILAVAAGFMTLASAMTVLAIAGFFAIPTLWAISSFAQSMKAAGFSQENIVKLIHGPDSSVKKVDLKDESKEEQWKTDLKNMANYLKELRDGFDTKMGGGYYTSFGNAVAQVTLKTKIIKSGE